MKTAYIVRGCSGSGKTTHSQNLVSIGGGKIYSADDYFMKDGKYIFKPSHLSKAHAHCLRTFTDAVREGKELTVICDNTNTREAEYAPYAAIAAAYGYDVRVITMLRPIDDCIKAAQKTHNVPSEIVWEQYKRLLKSEVPNYWKSKVQTHP